MASSATTVAMPTSLPVDDRQQGKSKRDDGLSGHTKRIALIDRTNGAARRSAADAEVKFLLLLSPSFDLMILGQESVDAK